MEELLTPKNAKFDLVQRKLGLLAQSKLQNLAETSSFRLQDKLNSMDQKLSEEITLNQKFVRDAVIKMKQYNDQIGLIEEKCNASKRQRSRELAELKDQIQKMMLKQHEKRKEAENWVSPRFEQNIKILQNQLYEAKQERKKQFNSFNLSLASDLPQLREEFLESSRQTDISISRKITHMQEECEEFRESINAQTYQREIGERKLMDHLRNVVGEIKQVISNEKVNRQQNRAKLVAMFDEAKKSIALA